MRKFPFVLLCFYFFLPLLAGCNKPQMDSADSIKAIYDLYILGDTSGISSLGMTEEEIAAAQQSYDISLKDAIRANFSASGQEIDEDTLEELCKARKEALSRMSASTEIIDESEGKSTVVIHTTYFNESDMDAAAFYDARETSQQMNFSTLEEQQKFLMEIYTENLITSYQNVTPSLDTTDVKVECVIQNNTWIPANMSSFGSDLALAVTGQQ